tara:strand:+ start:390 stop:761 length:372 start_codon:yes stop_codon:yes gene_type:complete
MAGVVRFVARTNNALHVAGVYVQDELDLKNAHKLGTVWTATFTEIGKNRYHTDFSTHKVEPGKVKHREFNVYVDKQLNLHFLNDENNDENTWVFEAVNPHTGVATYRDYNHGGGAISTGMRSR